MQSPFHHLSFVFILLFYHLSICCGFVPLIPQRESSQSSRRLLMTLRATTVSQLFPVLSKIQGINWEGTCRYVTTDFQPMPNLKLIGGTRYDLEADSCTMTSFLSFPDGRTRQVRMVGTKKIDGEASSSNRIMRLDPPDSDGPIYMVITELEPDTVLLNEIDKASGKIIMTSSLSVVDGGRELVQISHEVGEGRVPIEGHQIWRLKKSRNSYDMTGEETGAEEEESLFRDTTGR